MLSECTQNVAVETPGKVATKVSFVVYTTLRERDQQKIRTCEVNEITL